MATVPFLWGSGGAKVTPESLARQRKVAEALMSSGENPDTFWEGLQSAAGDIGGTLVNQRAADDEAAQQAAYGEQFDALGDAPTRDQLIGLASSPWANEGQSSVVSALLGQDLARSDPMYQMGLEKSQIELDAMRNPPPPDPWQVSEGETLVDPLTREVIFTGPQGGPDTIVENNVGGTDDFYTALDKKLGEQNAALLDAGATAAGNNIKIGELEKYLATAPQGIEGALTQFAGSIGIATDGLDDVQAAQAIINQLVPLQRPPGSGTMSDADLALFKASLPAIVNQPGGNAKIIQTLRGINDYVIAQADIAEQVANREISPAEGRKLQRAVPNPLENIDGVDAPAGPTEGETRTIDGVTYTFKNGQWTY